jgi:hypothetical protein
MYGGMWCVVFVMGGEDSASNQFKPLQTASAKEVYNIRAIYNVYNIIPVTP